jgi:hypothetical protein
MEEVETAGLLATELVTEAVVGLVGLLCDMFRCRMTGDGGWGGT